MAALRKALRNAWLGKRYAVIDGKENEGYAETPGPKTRSKEMGGLADRTQNNSQTADRPHLRRNTSVTQSVRDVVGTFRQKLKKSTRQRKRLQDGINSPATPNLRKSKRKGGKTPTRKGGYREVRLYSPFAIETPDNHKHRGIRTRPLRWNDIETPTRLRKEVEDLTANMQALVALTPRTLQTRALSRRSVQVSSSPLTNGSLKTPNSNRKVKVTQVRRNIQTSVL